VRRGERRRRSVVVGVVVVAGLPVGLLLRLASRHRKGELSTAAATHDDTHDTALTGELVACSQLGSATQATYKGKKGLARQL
jgi:hypothetical protein